MKKEASIKGGEGTLCFFPLDPLLLLKNCTRIWFKLFHTYHSHTDVWLVLLVWAQ